MDDANLNDQANYTKLSRLLIGKGTEALRKLFDTFSSPKLREFFNNNKRSLLRLKFSVIKKNQWDLLFPKCGNPDSKTFDISLLSVLLQNICPLTSPATGWCAEPNDTDRSPGANIVRTRRYRNAICAHAANTEVPDDKFEDLWSKISKTLIELGLSKSEVDHLRTSPASPEEESYIKALKDWKIQDEKIPEKLDEIKGPIEKVRKTNEVIAKHSEEIKESIKKIQIASSSQQQPDEHLLRNLSKFNFDGEIKELAGKFHPGTREWLLLAIENWFLTKGSKVFVLTAGPGVGKSVLAAKITQIYQEKEELVACHFSKFSNSNYSKPLFLIQSLARQICDSVKGFKEKLLEQLKGPYIVENLEDAFQVYLKEPLHKLPRMNPKLVVIDGLDEFERDGKKELLEVLAEEFSKLPSWLKVLVTSRPEINVKKTLRELHNKEITVKDKDNQMDIRKFLAYHLPETDRKQISKQTKKCDGSFLFVYYLKKDLQQDKETTDKKQSLPAGISDVYERYFDRLKKQLKEISEAYDITDLLNIIARAYQPIPLALFTEGLATNLKDMKKLKEVIEKFNETISTLLNVSDDSVTVYHKLVADWLIDKNHRYNVSLQEADTMLWNITEKKFDYLKNNKNDVSKIRSLRENKTIQHFLQYGFDYLFRAAKYSNLSFESLADVFISHLVAATFGLRRCEEAWHRFLLYKEKFPRHNDESESNIHEKVKWNHKHFSQFEVRPIYVQEFFNECPKEIVSDAERRDAMNILNNYQHFWCEKLGFLKLPPTTKVTACAFSPNGSQLVTCSNDGRICTWNINSRQMDQELFSNCENIISCIWSESEGILIHHHVGDNLMLSKCQVSNAQVSNIQVKKVTTITIRNETPLAFSAQAFICKSSKDSSIKVHRLTETNQITTSILEREHRHSMFAITRDGSSILAANKDHFKIWNISGTTSTEYKLAKEETFPLDKHDHKPCDCVKDILSCTISNNQKRGIISYYCSQVMEPCIAVIDMDVEHPRLDDERRLPYPTDEMLHFDLIEAVENDFDVDDNGEGDNDDDGNVDDDDDSDVDEDDDSNDDDFDGDDEDGSCRFYIGQSHKRLTVYFKGCIAHLTHFDHKGDLDYYKENSICRSGNVIALPQQFGGICMVKLHLPKPNWDDLIFRSRQGDFSWWK